MRELRAEEIEALAVGAWILGTGGGGSPYHGLLNMRRLYRDGVRVRLIDPQALADDDDVAVVSNMGAPLVTQERLTDSGMIARAVEVMQEYIGRRFRAVMGIEIGGGNSIQPLMAAAHLGVPVIDADAMGRAYPEAQMTSFAVGGLAPAPLVSVDPRGNEVIVTRAANWKWMERTSRKVCTEFGSIAATCKANRGHEDPIEAILKAEHGKRLFAGKIIEVERRTTEGFLRGRTWIEGQGRDRIQIDFQNEWIVVWSEGAPLASTPELICVLDSDTGEAIGTEMIRYGQRVTVILLPSPEIFLTPRGLEHVGPRAFGYDIDFCSVFA
jgi:DUF917 family protein